MNISGCCRLYVYVYLYVTGIHEFRHTHTYTFWNTLASPPQWNSYRQGQLNYTWRSPRLFLEVFLFQNIFFLCKLGMVEWWEIGHLLVASTNAWEHDCLSGSRSTKSTIFEAPYCSTWQISSTKMGSSFPRTELPAACFGGALKSWKDFCDQLIWIHQLFFFGGYHWTQVGNDCLTWTFYKFVSLKIEPWYWSLCQLRYSK